MTGFIFVTEDLTLRADAIDGIEVVTELHYTVANKYRVVIHLASGAEGIEIGEFSSREEADEARDRVMLSLLAAEATDDEGQPGPSWQDEAYAYKPSPLRGGGQLNSPSPGMVTWNGTGTNSSPTISASPEMLDRLKVVSARIDSLSDKLKEQKATAKTKKAGGYYGGVS